MNQVVLCSIILILIVLLLVTSKRTAEGFDITSIVNSAQSQINPLAKIAIKMPGSIQDAIYNIRGAPAYFPTPQETVPPSPVLDNINKCESKIPPGPVDAAFCDAAFSDTTFTQNCGVSIIPGTNSKGKPHTGGLYINPYDKNIQFRSDNLINGVDTTVYKPSFGSSSLFAVDKNTCKRMVAEQACTHGGVVGSKNSDYTCALCFSENAQHAFKTTDTLAAVIFTFFTNAIGTGTTCTLSVGSNRLITFTSGTTSTVNGISVTTVTTSPLTVKEGDDFTLTVSNTAKNAFIGGYLQSSTVNSQTYMIDINSFVSRVTSGEQSGIIQDYISYLQSGSTPMVLNGKIPFTFINPTNYDANNCKTGPFVSLQTSMTALNQGGCYSPDAVPGKYSLGCLQTTFKAVGGSTSGTGYPKTTTDTNNIQNLQYDSKGVARTLQQIVSYLTGLATQASTGMLNGKSLSVPDWNAVSMYMTGTPVLDPCDSANTRSNAPPSQDCLNFLYTDKNTYGDPADRESLSVDGKMPITCRPEGNLNPLTPGGLAAAAKKTKQEVINLYKSTFQTANDNTKLITDASRKKALQDCYGIASVAKGMPEVYEVGNPGTYVHKYSDAPAICSALGAEVATPDQVVQAQQAGAQVCGCGWTTDKNSIPYPMQQAKIPGCGDPPIANCYDWRTKSVKDVANATAHVWCYGPKPPKGTPGPGGSTILPFSLRVNDGKSWASGTTETWNALFVN
jgi:hypothetical protein